MKDVSLYKPTKVREYYMININPVVTYLKTGYLLHIITICELLMLYVLLDTLHAGAWIMESNTTARFFMLLPLLWSPIFPQLDARSRYQDYKLMKDYFYLYGFDARLARHFAKSRCQRNAVMVAAAEMGFESECRAYFISCGYKWYHLFPDVIFERPLVLLSKNFWVATFFTKTYRSKIDYNGLQKKVEKPVDLRVKAACLPQQIISFLL